MRKVEFDIVKNGRWIVYPDDMSLFSDCSINGDKVVGFYSGEMELTDHIEETTNEYPIEEFMEKLTKQEQIAFTSSSDVGVKNFFEIFKMHKNVATDDPVLVSGMDYLVSAGVLTQTRRDEILEVNL